MDFLKNKSVGRRNVLRRVRLAIRSFFPSRNRDDEVTQEGTPSTLRSSGNPTAYLCKLVVVGVREARRRFTAESTRSSKWQNGSGKGRILKLLRRQGLLLSSTAFGLEAG